jgi:hypothetical protein
MLLPEIPGAVPDSGFACHRTTQCREADLHDHRLRLDVRLFDPPAHR